MSRRQSRALLSCEDFLGRCMSKTESLVSANRKSAGAHRNRLVLEDHDKANQGEKMKSSDQDQLDFNIASMTEGPYYRAK